ncbi:unnamed protein product [Amoebophrya sp. A25]|nr:unnamed protein product [Amoebophrya sp. A25]|eukprot:GSA25T00027617001.1
MPPSSSLKESATAAKKNMRKLQGLPQQDDDEGSDMPTPTKQELKTNSLSGQLEELIESEAEETEAERQRREREEAEEEQRRADAHAALRVSGFVKKKLKAQARTLKSKVMRQRLRTLKIREGLHLSIPRCGIKLLLVQEKLGHFTSSFVQAGYEVIDMYKKYTDAEIDFILNSVEKVNEMSFEPDDRVTLYKLFRYRYFLAPGASKPLMKLSEIPRISLTKHSAKAPDDADTEMKHLESDRKRQVKRVPMFDEQAGMKMVQLERYDRELDIVYEIKDIQTCALEFEHLDPKTLLKRDPREEVLLRRMHRADRNVLRRLDYVNTRDTKRRATLEKLHYARQAYFYMFLILLLLSLLQNQDQGLGAMLSLIITTKSFVGAFSMYLGFLFAYRIAFYFKEGVDTYKLRKMLFVIKRFRSRLLKFRDKTEKERLERFDNTLANIDAFFEKRQREIQEEEQRKKDEELLRKQLSGGLTFDRWFEEKSKMLLLGGLRYVAISNKESEKVLHPPAKKAAYPDGDRGAKMLSQGGFQQNVTRGRTVPIQTIDNFPGGSTRAIRDRTVEVPSSSESAREEQERLLSGGGNTITSPNSRSETRDSRQSKRSKRRSDKDADDKKRGVSASDLAKLPSVGAVGRRLAMEAAAAASAEQIRASVELVVDPGDRQEENPSPLRSRDGEEEGERSPFGLGSSASVANVDPARLAGLIGHTELMENEVLGPSAGSGSQTSTRPAGGQDAQQGLDTVVPSTVIGRPANPSGGASGDRNDEGGGLGEI